MGNDSVPRRYGTAAVLSMIAPCVCVVAAIVLFMMAMGARGESGWGVLMLIGLAIPAGAIVTTIGLVLAIVSLVKKRSKMLAAVALVANLTILCPTAWLTAKFYLSVANDPYGSIHSAVKDGDKRKVDRLASKGFDLNVTNGYEDDFTPLNRAAAANNIGMVKLLIEQGARVDTTRYAVGTNNQELVLLLLEHGAKAAGMDEAIRKHNVEMMQLLLDHGADINEKPRNWNGGTLLHGAVAVDPETVAFLISKGADVSARDGHGETPLHSVAGAGDDGGRRKLCDKIRVVDILLAAGADINARSREGKTPLDRAVELAAWSGQTENMLLLMRRGADPNGITNPQMGLIAMSYKVDKATLARWIKANIKDVNGKIINGPPVLFVAARAATPECVAALLDAGAAPRVADHENLKVLHYAICNPQLEVIDVLVARGADVNAQDRFGKTPLHCVNTLTMGEERLLGDPNNGVDRTPLIGVLLANGADVNVKDSYQQSVVDSCRSWCPQTAQGARYKQKVLDMLTKHQAKGPGK